MSLTLLLFSLMLFQQSFCAPPTTLCKYKTSSTDTTGTDVGENYLDSSDDENVNKIKCFSLSNNGVNTANCCYYKDADNNNKPYCAQAATGTTNTICPVATEITNNCGMALYYQPEEPGDCIDISLVDGYCCYVQTKSHGKACIRQGEIDEDDKNKITDELKNAVNRLKSSSISGNVEIEKVQCEGYYMTFYGLSLLLLAVML